MMKIWEMLDEGFSINEYLINPLAGMQSVKIMVKFSLHTSNQTIYLILFRGEENRGV